MINVHSHDEKIYVYKSDTMSASYEFLITNFIPFYSLIYRLIIHNKENNFHTIPMGIIVLLKQ